MNVGKLFCRLILVGYLAIKILFLILRKQVSIGWVENPPNLNADENHFLLNGVFMRIKG